MNSINCLVLLAFFLIPAISRAAPAYNLSVEIDIRNSKIIGTAELIPGDDEEFIFNLENLNILEIKPGSGPYDETNVIKIYGKKKEPIRIKYEAVFNNPSSSNVINEKGVFLTDNWYPSLDVLCIYNLTARFPKGFEAISEAEDIKKTYEKEHVNFNFKFPYPLERAHLIASDRFIVAEEIYKGISLSSYFFQEDSHLSKGYLSYTKKYIDMYESMICEFPYRRFAIVENLLPTGYSMPTFTLLGQSVVRLPFIVETSLGHEILHQWFGNYVYINFEEGNWAEGLTTYLADHFYEELKGRGWLYRKNILIDYYSYVKPEEDFPLIDFRGRFDNSSSAIGYGRSAMVFHLLKNTVGEEDFYASLKHFIKENRFRRASWDDVETAFEKSYGGDLSWFFEQWLNRKGLPQLEVKNTRLKVHKGKFHLTSDILQEGDIYRLSLPLSIYYSNNTRAQQLLGVSKEKESVSLYLKDEPLKIEVDENYDIPRKLSRPEVPPVISRILGEDRIIFVLPRDKKGKYESFMNSFKEKKVTIKTPEETEYEDIKSNFLVLFDKENPVIKRLYGNINMDDEGFSIIVKENPWNDEKVIALVHGQSKEEVELGYKKIFHYGKYSSLAFKNGTNTHKDVAESEKGIVVELREPAKAVYVPSITDVGKIIQDVKEKKLVYIGEHHDELAHHISQLNIIKELYKMNKKLAIGMEMFQRPFQKEIDDYINGKIDERQFLKKTEYFKRWGLDYNLYKPIVDYAKENKIPIVALNMDRAIVTKVSQSGMDNLTEGEKNLLPLEMDFSDKDYEERLREVFKEHPKSKQGNFDHFFQAQVIWDEAMAESIDRFLSDNPGSQIVVLAGSGHIRYGSGIPKRAFRRNGYAYSIILNDEDIDEDIGDYVLYPEKMEGTTSPKLGVLLNDERGRLKISEFTEGSVGKKAGLEKGDIIFSFDGYPIQSIEDIKIALFYEEEGSMAKIKVLRDSGEEQTVEIRF